MACFEITQTIGVEKLLQSFMSAHDRAELFHSIPVFLATFLTLIILKTVCFSHLICFPAHYPLALLSVATHGFVISAFGKKSSLRPVRCVCFSNCSEQTLWVEYSNHGKAFLFFLFFLRIGKSRVRQQSNSTLLSLAVQQLRGLRQASAHCFLPPVLKKTARCHPYNHYAAVRRYSEMPIRPSEASTAVQNVCQFSTLHQDTKDNFMFQTASVHFYFFIFLLDFSLPSSSVFNRLHLPVQPGSGKANSLGSLSQLCVHSSCIRHLLFIQKSLSSQPRSGGSAPPSCSLARRAVSRIAVGSLIDLHFPQSGREWTRENTGLKFPLMSRNMTGMH